MQTQLSLWKADFMKNKALMSVDLYFFFCYYAFPIKKTIMWTSYFFVIICFPLKKSRLVFFIFF